MSKNSKKFSGNMIQFSTFVIALTALGLSMWQGYEYRRHNRLALQPAISANRYDDQKTKSIKITITNSGLGPAIITGFDIYLDSNLLKGDNCGWDALIESL